jgi:membrane protease YdiL (CAAX protease family)
MLVWGLLLYAANVTVQLLVFTITDDLFLPVAAGSLLAILLPCYFAAHRYQGSLAADFRLGKIPLTVSFWAAVAALAALLPTSLLAQLSVRIYPIPQIWIDFYFDRLPQGEIGIALGFITVAVIAPVGEELLFRGIVHRWASRLWGPLPAVILSSLIFALVHFEPWYLFGLFGLALLLGFIYEATRSVTACSVTHGAHNAISYFVLVNQEDPAATTVGGLELDVLLLGGSLFLLALACQRLVHHGGHLRERDGAGS